MIHQANPVKSHWNYFIALEHDMETVSRYIEFSESNYEVYSIELAHLLFAAASEVDVISKLLCEAISPSQPRNNINNYQTVLKIGLPEICSIQVFVPRFGLILTPWENWAANTNPNWWASYNNVKHQRDICFNEATLKNALNALGALLIMNYYHYSYKLSENVGQRLKPKDTTHALEPQSTLLRLHEDDYYHIRIC